MDDTKVQLSSDVLKATERLAESLIHSGPIAAFERAKVQFEANEGAKYLARAFVG